MNQAELVIAIRKKSIEVGNVYMTTDKDNNLLHDATDLLRVLANLVDGMPLAKAFGLPGDWGYNTPIGAAIAAPLSEP